MIKAGLFLLLSLLCQYALASSQVGLEQGINRIDLNGNGKKDYVIVSIFDKNMSYNQTGLTFFVRGENDELNIVPTSKTDDFIWLDRRIASASITVEDNRVYRSGNTIYLVSVNRDIDNNAAFSPGLVTLSVYRFNTSEKHAGVPSYEWLPLKTITSEKVYVSAEQAFEEVNASVLRN